MLFRAVYTDTKSKTAKENRAMLYVCSALLAAALLGLDQWLKHYVTVNIPLGEAQPLLPGPAFRGCAGCWGR